MRHDELLAAIRRNPRDAEIRLVYADWLEEHDDSRGELIRVMEEMRALPPASDRFWELRPRRTLLLPGVDEEWLTALGYNVYRPLFCQMPAERSHRWRLMLEFLETWYGAVNSDAGHSEEEIAGAERQLGVRFPAAVREWYALVGRQLRYWRHRDHCWPLNVLRLKQGRLSFRRESSWKRAEWVVADHGQEDPPVLLVDGEHGERVECESFSEFILLCMLLEAYWQPKQIFWLGGDEPKVCDEVERTLSRVNASDRYWQFEQLVLWEGKDLICVDSPQLFRHGIVARRESAMQALPVVVASSVRMPRQA